MGLQRIARDLVRFGPASGSVALAMLIAACTPADQDIVAREAARATITPMVEARFPGVPVAPVVNCAIDNANATEIVTLASASVVGVTPTTTQTLNTILSRPQTVNCIASVGLTGLLGAAL